MTTTDNETKHTFADGSTASVVNTATRAADKKAGKAEEADGAPSKASAKAGAQGASEKTSAMTTGMTGKAGSSAQ
jgi:hypothetical protein